MVPLLGSLKVPSLNTSIAMRKIGNGRNRSSMRLSPMSQPKTLRGRLQRSGVMYSDFARSSAAPLDVPLLIPEFRYDGRLPKHKYRLDFRLIDADTMDKVGFEFSPWPTHGLLTGTKGKTQKEINDEAQANFENEMKKHKNFFKKHGVFALIYTDSDLADPDAVFADIKTYLEPRKPAKQLSFQLLEQFFS
jgi:hypothetical protein